MNLSENLKALLAEKEMTMTALANKTDITYNMIKKYCAGEADPTITYARRIAEVLQTSVDGLIGYEAPVKKSMFQEVFERDFTYIEGFMKSVRKFKNKEALVDPMNDKSWTYDELNKEVNRFANALMDFGIMKGDVVFYQMPNTPEFVFSYLAPQKLGAVTSPANFNFSPFETASCIDSSKPKVYLYDSSIKEMAVKAIESAEHKPEIVIMSGKGDAPEGHVKYEDFIRGYHNREPECGYIPHMYDEVMRLYTSGTTGMPKGVPLYHANEVLSAHDVIMHFPLNSTDTTMNTTPWFHRGGIHSGGPAPTFYAGGTVIIMKAFSPQTALKYCEKFGVTFLIGVPSIMQMLVRHQERYGADLSKLKGIVTMGAPFERVDCIKIHSLMTPNIYNGYGTTETFWNTFLRPYELPEMAGTAGRACTFDEVRVVKVFEDRKAAPDELAEMNDCEVGEVIIRTTKSSYCYFNNPEEESKKFQDGWMYTGDLATWDKDQFVTINGRKDDMIISGGENIYPPIIEEALNLSPLVAQSAVTSVPDKIRGEAVVAYIVPENDNITVGEMVDFCNQSEMLSAYKRPRYYRFVKELPMTATGKLQHYIVKEMALSDLESGLLKLAMKGGK